MITAEYVRNYNCNYERIALDNKPEEKRYQYCILSRGGIRYLLPCSLRYIDSNAYLYYDISSTQNLEQVFREKKITREWFKDFLWGMKQMRYELDRFLLEEDNIIWKPEHIYQDLEKNDFFFLYVPYYEGEGGLMALFDFFVEHIEYSDETLVEFIYEIHEKVQRIGKEYLQKQIHEDFEKLESRVKESEEVSGAVEEGKLPTETEVLQHEKEELWNKESSKKGIRFFREGRKKRQAAKEDYREALRQKMEGRPVYAVCEESHYNEKQSEPDFMEEYGKTIYIDDTVVNNTAALYKPDGEKAAELEKLPFVIGKKKDSVDLVINDYSASRIHARITREEGIYYIEDLNSTNGTYKNGLRLQPYEKRKLEKDDELKFGKTEYIYR